MPLLDYPPIARGMADFVCKTAWEDLPAAVQREALRAWLNWLGCTVGGSQTPSAQTALKGLLSMGDGDVPVIGYREKLSISDAALLGSLFAATHTYDDTHLATITHPTGPVASALLAASYRLSQLGKPVNGLRLLLALTIGLELECRVSCAIAAGGGNQGWYMTGLSGGIGAAAAVAKILSLTEQQTVYAIGLAATQASGTRATHGAMAINFVPGIAARDGLVAAYMAAANYTCRDISIDGKNGLLQVLTGAHDATAIRDDLGSRFEMLNNSYKPYPCGIVIHPSIDACLYLANELRIDFREITQIELHVHPDALNLCWRKLPDNVLDAQVSLYHWVGVALCRGKAGVEQGTLECIEADDVRSLQNIAHAQADTTLKDNQAVVRLTLANGKTIERKTDNAIGSVTNPMTDEQLQNKFKALVTPVFGSTDAQALLSLCLNTANLADVSEILKASARPC